MTWLTVDADDTRIPHATEALATLHALRVSRVTGGEVAVVGPERVRTGPRSDPGAESDHGWAGRCGRPRDEQCGTGKPCACRAEVEEDVK